MVKERKNVFVSSHIVISSPALSQVLKVPLENSKEFYIACYSLHFIGALKDVDISLVLKLHSDLSFMISLSNLRVCFCCA